jgi:hypothetical protein
MAVPGLGTRALKLEIEGIDYSNAVSTVKVTSGESDSDFLTFAQAAAGGSRQYKLNLTLAQDLTASSLFRLILDHAGDEVDVVIRPNGGSAASPSQAQYTFTAIVSEPDGDLLGGDADTSTTARFTTEVEWEILDRPVLVTS